ncbi:MAG: site-specific integrase [Candidatus Sulfotelmatobacter sp.]
MRASQCVVYSRKRGTWHLKWYEHGKPKRRQLGTIREFPSRAMAEKAAEPFRRMLAKPVKTVPTVSILVEQYKLEKMSTRASTSHSVKAWLRNHIVPQWGDKPITDLQARPVDLWLRFLPLSPKSKVHIRGVIRELWEYAMYRNDVELQRNPMELVRIKGATKRLRKPRCLTVEEFHRFVAQLDGAFRAMALVCISFGLRISECLALKWSDVDWLNAKLSVERGIVRQVVGDVKTEYSGRAMNIDPAMLAVLKSWRQETKFSADSDWVFASPLKLGRLPWSYPWVWRVFTKAAKDAGIGALGTHTMRHSYRSWLDAVGTPMAVQQKLMRHASITTTMNIYGDVVTDEMAAAHSKVVQLALAKQ